MTTEAPGLWQVREYDATRDAEMVSAWWRTHGNGEFPFKILPPAGLIVECDGRPAAACWLYMAVGIGVCWLEHPVGRPGLAPFNLVTAFRHLMEAMDAVAAAHDYHVMFAHAVPGIARVMKRIGFMPENRTKITLLREAN
jgi:hypothetical protein